MKKKTKAKAGKEAKTLLDVSAKQTMLAVVCRNVNAFEQVRDLLTVDDLRQFGDGYALVYKAVKEFYDEYSELPAKAQLVDKLEQAIADGGSQIDDSDVDVLGEFVDLIFDKKTWGPKSIVSDDTYLSLAVKTVKRYKHELIASKLSESVFSGTKVPADLAAVLRDSLLAVEEAESLDSREVPQVFAKGWQSRKKVVLQPTGVAALDSFTGGGIRSPELLLFMGPYGSCKTTVAVQGVTASALVCRNKTVEASAAGKNVRYVEVYASYEMPVEEFRERCIACAARVPRHRQEKLADYSELRPDDTDLNEYETIEFSHELAQGLPVESEASRVNMAVNLINDHILFLDLSNTDPSNPCGMGGVKELAAILAGEIRRAKSEGFDTVINTVWVDHAAAMVGNQVGSEDYNVSEDATRKILKFLPKHLASWIGKRFATRVVLMHQLSGQANSKGPTASIHHTDADECKSIGMFCDFCVNTGPQTNDERQLCVWECTKHRRQPPSKRHIIKIDGQFNRVFPVSAMYTIDPFKGKIVSNAEYGSVNGSVKAAAKPGGDDDSSDDKKAKKKKKADKSGVVATNLTLE